MRLILLNPYDFNVVADMVPPRYEPGADLAETCVNAAMAIRKERGDPAFQFRFAKDIPDGVDGYIVMTASRTMPSVEDVGEDFEDLVDMIGRCREVGFVGVTSREPA